MIFTFGYFLPRVRFSYGVFFVSVNYMGRTLFDMSAVLWRHRLVYTLSCTCITSRVSNYMYVVNKGAAFIYQMKVKIDLWNSAAMSINAL